MAQLREIKKRIKAVGNIQRITKTMQMIATARFQAAVRRSQATRPYTDKLYEIAGELASAGGSGEDGHPLLSAPSVVKSKKLVLVISSNRGLCGAYNANVLRTAATYLKSDSADIELEVVGKKGLAFFRFAGRAVAAGHTHFTDKPSYESVEELGNSYIDRFVAGEFDSVHVVYMRFISNAKQTPEVLQLLPLKPPAVEDSGEAASGGDSESIYEYSPDPATLLSELLPLTVKSTLFQAFNDAVVSEQISRMVAMKAATDNAGKMGKNLKRSFNRARQAQITTELSEIIAGAAALS